MGWWYSGLVLQWILWVGDTVGVVGAADAVGAVVRWCCSGDCGCCG